MHAFIYLFLKWSDNRNSGLFQLVCRYILGWNIFLLMLQMLRYKKLITICLFLFEGCSIHQVDKEGLTALCWGCLKGHLHIIQNLLDRGSNLHHTDRCGRTPLQLASFHGDAHVVSSLCRDLCTLLLWKNLNWS